MSLEEAVIGAMSDRGLTLGIAESCTGGLLASRLTGVPGASAVLLGSVVAYSNESKSVLLGVPERTLIDNGAVSGEVAGEMAIGARRALASDIGISMTCIAGPGGATEEKPVGLSYVGLSSDDGTYVARLELKGSRAWVRAQLAEICLTMLLDHLGVEPEPLTGVSLVVVGDEVLAGHTVDTNSNLVSKTLFGIGTPLESTRTVGDETGAIGDAVVQAMNRSRTVIVVGGLGPTPDDVTVEAISSVLGDGPVESPAAIDMVSRRIEEGHRAGLVSDPTMNEGRRKMALVPAGARILDNDVGYGPGCRLDVAGRMLFLLPGVPRELEHMLARHVVPSLESSGDPLGVVEVVHRGSESVVAPVLEEVAEEYPTVRIGSYPDLETYSTTIRFTGPPDDITSAAEDFRTRVVRDDD